jgi:hypothetical protein
MLSRRAVTAVCLDIANCMCVGADLTAINRNAVFSAVTYHPTVCKTTCKKIMLRSDYHLLPATVYMFVNLLRAHKMCDSPRF